MGKREAIREIQRILREGGSVILTTHSKERMAQRGFDMPDIEHVLKTGYIYKEAEPHPVTAHWIYNVEGKTVDGKKLRVAVDILDDGTAVIFVSVM